MLTASYIYVLCQALDLRALQFDREAGLSRIVRDQLTRHFGAWLQTAALDDLFRKVSSAIRRSLENTSKMDCHKRMETVAASTTVPIVDFCSTNAAYLPALAGIAGFRAVVAKEGAAVLDALRSEYIEGKNGPTPASRYLGRTKGLYEYIRVTLGVTMHGRENLHGWKDGPGMEDASIGENISLIHEVSLPATVANEHMLTNSHRPSVMASSRVSLSAYSARPQTIRQTVSELGT